MVKKAIGSHFGEYIYLRPKVTLHFSVPNISTLILILSKLNIAMSFQHMP